MLDCFRFLGGCLRTVIIRFLHFISQDKAAILIKSKVESPTQNYPIEIKSRLIL